MVKRARHILIGINHRTRLNPFSIRSRVLNYQRIMETYGDETTFNEYSSTPSTSFIGNHWLNGLQ